MSSHGVEKRVKRRNWQQIDPCAREKTRADWKKDLQICGEGRKSRKRSALVVDKPYGKCQFTCLDDSINMYSMKSIRFILTLSLLSLVGCTVPNPKTDTIEKNSNYTHGSVQLYLKKGMTTQTEVLEKFGAPNVATMDGQGNEVWTYQKHATVSREAGGYATILILGGGTSGFEQSSKTMTLIIKFDSKKVVSDFNSMYTSF